MLFHSDKTKDNLVAAMPRYGYSVESSYLQWIWIFEIGPNQ